MSRQFAISTAPDAAIVSDASARMNERMAVDLAVASRETNFVNFCAC